MLSIKSQIMPLLQACVGDLLATPYIFGSKKLGGDVRILRQLDTLLALGGCSFQAYLESFVVAHEVNMGKVLPFMTSFRRAWALWASWSWSTEAGIPFSLQAGQPSHVQDAAWGLCPSSALSRAWETFGMRQYDRLLPFYEHVWIRKHETSVFPSVYWED